MSNSPTRLEKFQEYLQGCHEIKNLTPHNVKLLTDKFITVYESAGEALRIPERFVDVGTYSIHKIKSKEFLHDKVMLPEFEDGVLNIVSLVVAQYVAQHTPERVDFITMGKYIRNENGVIEGIENFAFIE